MGFPSAECISAPPCISFYPRSFPLLSVQHRPPPSPLLPHPKYLPIPLLTSPRVGMHISSSPASFPSRSLSLSCSLLPVQPQPQDQPFSSSPHSKMHLRQSPASLPILSISLSFPSSPRPAPAKPNLSLVHPPPAEDGTSLSVRCSLYPLMSTPA